MIDNEVKFFEDSLSDNPQGTHTRAEYKIRHKWIIDILSSQFKEMDFSSWLDVGCSDGRLSKEFRHFSKIVYGIDIAYNFKYVFEKNNNLVFIAGETPNILNKLSTDGRKFDVISCFGMLDYLKTDQISFFIKNIDVLLNDRGYFITDFNNELLNELIEQYKFDEIIKSSIAVPRYKLNFLYFKVDRFFIAAEILLYFLNDKNKLNFLLKDRFHTTLYKIIMISPLLAKYLLIILQPIKTLARIINGNTSIFNFLKIFGTNSQKVIILRK